MNAPFWEDLDALRNAIPPDFDEKHPFWFVAATWHTDIGFPNEEKQHGKILGPHIGPTRPERRSSAWRLLGFDITGSGISGLSNCGYDASELDYLAKEWSSDLNGYHLFDDLERAFEFRKLTNARVPEHAPFFVIGLWLIAKSIPR